MESHQFKQNFSTVAVQIDLFALTTVYRQSWGRYSKNVTSYILLVIFTR